jgi:hypothetical protein
VARPVPAGAGWWLFAVLVGVRVVSIVVLLGSGVEHDGSILGGDGRRYQEITEGWGTPYQDFEVEYPPGALVFIEMITTDDTLETIARLAVSQLVLELVVAALLAWAWSRRTALYYMVLGTPIIFFPFAYARLDLLTVALGVAGVALLRKGYDRFAGAILGLSVFVKLWPVALAPLVLVERRWRAVGALVTTGLLGLAVWVTLFGTQGFSQVATFRGADGWQIESIPGIVGHMLDPTATQVEQGAWRTGADMPAWARLALTAASTVTIGWCWWLADRTLPGGDATHRSDEARYALAPLGSVLALLVFAPIISPQYILWFLPFAAIAAVGGRRLLGWLALAVSVLTTYVLATIHAQVEGKLYATLPIVARNVVLVVMLVICVRELLRSAQPTGGHQPDDLVTQPPRR